MGSRLSNNRYLAITPWHLATVLALFAGLGSPRAAAAQGWVEPHRPIPTNIVKLRTTVSVSVTGRVAEVHVEEWFRNDGGGLGEGDYHYPLPGEAVFSNFSLYQGDTELRGETMEADRARSIYEAIVRRRKDPALIELVGHGLVRARIFPIGPGETRKITLRYTQVLPRAGDALQFRYAAGGVRVGGEGPTAPHVAPGGAPLTFELTADRGDRFGDPFSPSHRVRVSREGSRLTVRPATDLTGSFTLFLPLVRDAVGITVATHRPTAHEPGYFMLTLSPGRTQEHAVPRDLTVVTDVSGSMSGSKMTQTRAALRQLLSSLRPTDRFRLVSFSNRVSVHRPGWVSATQDQVDDAGRWIDGLEAGGGTNIAGALEEALRLPSPTGRLPIVVFLTDGLPSVGERDPERIAATAGAARDRTRIFAFGVGYDVNTHLLDRLSVEGHGATAYVEPGEDVEQALSMLAAKINHPVLTDLALDDTPVRLREIYPTTLPDLFAGEELIVFGRYEIGREDVEGDLTVTGRRGERTHRFSTASRFVRHGLENDFIPRLWASRKLGFLTRTMRLEGETEALRREIRETALRYGLLSEFTSYLVLEPEMMTTRHLPREQPADRPRASVAVGQQAVRAAEEARAQREVSSAADLQQLDDRLTGDANRPNVRTVAGRRFERRGGIWTDVTHVTSQPVVEIVAFSDDYFALLRLAPELRPWLSRMEQVMIGGARVSIKIVAGGPVTAPGADLARVVRDFRGM